MGVNDHIRTVHARIEKEEHTLVICAPSIGSSVDACAALVDAAGHEFGLSCLVPVNKGVLEVVSAVEVLV